MKVGEDRGVAAAEARRRVDAQRVKLIGGVGGSARVPATAAVLRRGLGPATAGRLGQLQLLRPSGVVLADGFTQVAHVGPPGPVLGALRLYDIPIDVRQ